MENQSLDKNTMVLFERARKSPLFFAESMLVDPFLDSPFSATYPQKAILTTKKKTTWIAVHRRGGKMAPLTSKVYTPEGYKLMGAIKVGDEVLTPAGTTARVNAIIPHGLQKIYRIHFIDGSYCDSGFNHDWIVFDGSKEVKVTSKDLYEFYQKAKAGGFFNYRVNQIKPIEHSRKDLELDPYIVGLLLGGCEFELNRTNFISKEAFEFAEARAPGILELKARRELSNKERYKVDPELVEKVFDGLELRNKYKYCSKSQRQYILKGALNAAPEFVSCSKDGVLEIRATRPSVAKNLAEIFRSFGCKTRLELSSLKVNRSIFRKHAEDGIIAKLTIYLVEELIGILGFSCESLKDPFAQRRSIVKVELLEEEVEMQCISIDDQDHLYLMDNYTPTHNCVAEDALVVDPNSLRPILLRDAQKTTKTLTFDFILNKTLWAPSTWLESGVKDCILLKLGSGETIKVSKDHKVFSKHKGWAEVKNLKIGDQILAPSEIPIFGPKNLAEEDLKELFDLTIEDKKVPDDVFLLTKESLILYFSWFLQEYSTIHRKDKIICIAIPHINLLQDLQHLLLRLGIVSRIDFTNSKLWLDEEPDFYRFLDFYGQTPFVSEVRSPRRWARIVGLYNAGKCKVYDLAVEHHDHNFLANNIVVHNSYSLSILAIWHAITQESQKIVIFAPSSNQVNVIFDNIDAWIYKNPLIEQLKAPNGNHKQPNQRRTFLTGSTIDGFPLGVSGGQEAGKRGITADVVLCLPYSERVLTDIGWVPIGKIVEKNLAQEVLTYNHTKNTLEWKKILRRIKNPIGNRKLVELKTSDSRLQLTEDHKIFTVEEGYKKAKDFKQNNTILQIPFDLSEEEIYQGKAKLEDPVYPAADDYPVYDLTIEGNHNFFAEGVLVHNCDEAQEFGDEDWKVVGPIMKGDRFRMNKMKNYVTGTINAPKGFFYEKVVGLVEQADSESIIKIPITQNKSYTPEEVAQLKSETPPKEWQTEWMLQADEQDSSVFRILDIERCSAADYSYGPYLINPNLPRFMGIDWDKAQAGTNITIIQYNPELKTVDVIYREEVPRGDFTFLSAVQRVVSLYDIYSPDLVIADQGAGEVQWEMLAVEGMKLRNGLAERLVKKAFNEKIETFSFENEELEKKRIKPFLVGLLQQKIQQTQFRYPKSDKILTDQLLQYRVKTITESNIKYTSKNEHIIDCCLFALWGVWYLYENWLTDQNPTTFRNVIDGEKTFPWEREALDAQATNERFDHPGTVLPRESFDSFYRSEFERDWWLD